MIKYIYMAELEELTEKIKTRLSEQNQILKDCVQKYQNSQKERKDNRNKISLRQAGEFVKWVIDSPADINIHYMAMDPIQKDQ